MSLFARLAALGDQPCWLVQFEGPLGGHGWALVLGATVPNPHEGQILAAYAVPDDMRYMHVSVLRAMARNGTLTKVEAQHG